jgi:hypothetical protein
LGCTFEHQIHPKRRGQIFVHIGWPTSHRSRASRQSSPAAHRGF